MTPVAVVTALLHWTCLQYTACKDFGLRTLCCGRFLTLPLQNGDHVQHSEVTREERLYISMQVLTNLTRLVSMSAWRERTGEVLKLCR